MKRADTTGREGKRKAARKKSSQELSLLTYCYFQFPRLKTSSCPIHILSSRSSVGQTAAIRGRAARHRLPDSPALCAPHFSAKKTGPRPGLKKSPGGRKRRPISRRNCGCEKQAKPSRCPGFRRRRRRRPRMLICRLPRKLCQVAQRGKGGVAGLSGRRRGGGWAPGCLGVLVVPPPPPPPPPPLLCGRGACVGGWRNQRWRMEEGGGGARSLVPGGPVLLVLCGLLEASGGGRALPQLSDDIPFRVNWPGTEFSLPTTGVFYKEDNYVIMTTTHKEKYKCILPLVTGGDEEEEKDYKGPNPRELLEPLFKQSSCSYRIESYWTYEVCHGKHIRQYHEEKESGQKVNIHEYYLGNMLAKNLLSEKEQEAEEKEKSKEIPTKNIEGQMTPYYPVGMGNGTPCSLKQNRPRSSTVMYICHPESKHEILSVAEVTTCEYEVVILTPLLCNHPKYRFRASPVNDIFCQSLPGSPFKPLTLRQLEQQEEILRVPFRRSKEEDLQSTKEERFPAIHKPIAVGSQLMLTVGTTHISKLTDDQLIKEFLSGSYCFHGGVGWWKYEFCYGKHVHQYHEDKDSGKTSVVVGTWNQEEHIEWAKKNTARAYHLQDDGTQTVRMVSHFYGNGDICDITDKPRQVTVKLKCKESDSPHAVTVYMLEPHSCQYILGVESPVICKILDTADENGLLSLPN